MPTLLLADDNVTTQRVIALTFADQAFQVVTVGSSQQARDLMAGMRPDIVLASTSLPRNSGYELSEYMLGVESLKDVPVLLLSGAFESVNEARLATSGARGVIEKPLEPTAVINRVRELLGLKEAPPAPPAGRLITPAATTADKKQAADADLPPAVGRKAPPEGPPHDPLAAAVARAAQRNTPGHAAEDYRETLDTAFDSLDQHFAGRPSETPAAPDSRLPERPLAVPNAPTPTEGLDFDFGLDDLLSPQAAKEQTPASPASALSDPEPTVASPPPEAIAYEAPVHQAQVHPAPLAPVAPSSVADDFAALLAIETGDAPPPPVAAQSVAVQAAAPEITDAMLDQIAQRVADRLSSGTFGVELREAMAETLRDSVRTVVSETAERLVREEIARVKARIERDTP